MRAVNIYISQRLPSGVSLQPECKLKFMESRQRRRRKFPLRWNKYENFTRCLRRKSEASGVLNPERSGARTKWNICEQRLSLSIKVLHAICISRYSYVYWSSQILYVGYKSTLETTQWGVGYWCKGCWSKDFYIKSCWVYNWLLKYQLLKKNHNFFLFLS